MTFALDGSASKEEVLGAVNYLLSNLSPANYSNQQTGEIVDSGGQVIGYLYKYIYIKYADSFDGTTNFSDLPTNRLYYGIRNSDSATESTNPADYVWVQVSGGFGTTKTLWYLTTGGRQIQFQVATSQPNPGWIQDGGGSIDLDFITSSISSPANFIVVRITNNSSAPTNTEVLGAIGRLPISGDLCTINYNSGISSILYKYTTGWAPYIRYITSDLIVADSIIGSSIKAGTITADKLSASYIQVGGAAGDVNSGTTTINGGKITANSITADKLTASYIQVGGAAGDVNSGTTTINGGKITANTITADKLTASYVQVGGSAADVNSGTTTINGGQITANTITADRIAATTIFTNGLRVGSSPAISGTTMTGAGGYIYNDGTFALGNSSSNIVFDGTNAYINGFSTTSAVVSAGGANELWNYNTYYYEKYSSETVLTNFTNQKPVFVSYSTQLRLWLSTTSNPKIPERVNKTVRCQYAYSTDNGASYSSWANASANSYIYFGAVADHSTSVTGSNRNFYGSGASFVSLSFASNVTNVKFRFYSLYECYQDIYCATTAYFNQPYTPDPTKTDVSANLDNVTALIYQLKV